jgi:hypothetical protein
LIITLAVKKNANFFAENWQKSQKIVIITSTPVRQYQGRQCAGWPDWANFRPLDGSLLWAVFWKLHK